MMAPDVRPVIMVVDDDTAIQRSLKSVLETYGYIIQSFGSAAEALRALKQKSPDCIVLDVRMPEIDGLAAQRLLIQSGNTIPTIFITGHGDIATAVAAMKGGAVDYIEKPIDDERLAAAIDASLKLRKKNSRDLLDEDLERRFSSLTNREKAVAELVADGYSTTAIASLLGISARTVDHHRANILSKMGATSLPQLIRFLVALQN